jgi:valyl-tRNA synthetase
MENVKDWCISRQLWWGHRIPAYYIGGSNEYVVAGSFEEALISAKEKTGDNSLSFADLHQDEDVLDTWFSSWLWPISVFDGIRHPGNADMNYYYPTDDLVTAPEILFFWVARMIMAGYEFAGDKPFRNVYLTGIVRDKIGRKMSKSLGNSPDPLELINKYGADGVRVGMLLCSPAGNDLLFDESLSEQGRNFGNKIWNAFRLVKGWQVVDVLSQPETSKLAVKWFSSLLNQTIETLDDHFSKFRISDALMTVYKLFWDEFSSWYLEIIKPSFRQPVDKTSYNETIVFFDKLLRLLHPFMPFITEEIWHLTENRKKGESIMISKLPEASEYDKSLILKFETVKEVITNIRKIRNDRGIPQKEYVHLYIRESAKKFDHTFDCIIKKLGMLTTISNTNKKIEHAVSFILKSGEFFIPLDEQINIEEEIRKLEGELEYTRGFLNMVLNKLGNERFVQNAPEKVIIQEKAKKADAEAKIKVIEERIESLKQ